MAKKKVLFVCIHNSARSVMAERFVREFCGDRWEAISAGLEPGTLNPIVQQAMAEVGIDVSDHKPQAVFDVFKSGIIFAQVVTVCDETSAERCAIFPGAIGNHEVGPPGTSTPLTSVSGCCGARWSRMPPLPATSSRCAIWGFALRSDPTGPF